MHVVANLNEEQILIAMLIKASAKNRRNINAQGWLQSMDE